MVRIFSGDDTDFRGDQRLALVFAAPGVDFSGCTAELEFLGQRRIFSNPVSGGRLAFSFSSDETRGMRCGVWPVTIRLRDQSGRVRTVDNSQRIKVTDDVDEAYADAEQELSVSLVTGGVAMPEIPADLDADAADSVGDFKRKFNTLLGLLRGSAAALAVMLCAFPAFGASVETSFLNDLPGTSEVVTGVDFGGLAKSAEVEGLSRSVSAVWSYAYGNSVWIAVTNYLRTVDGVAPSLGLWEVRDGKTNLVYSTADEITNATAKTEAKLTSSFQNGINSLRKEIPSTAWSRYQSMSGAPNPASNDVTVISTPLIMLTGGAEWTQYVDVSSNSLWVLSSKGMVVPTVDTNGYFRIYDSEGKTAFEVVQEQAMIVDALPSDIHSPSEGVMSVTFRANAKPVLYTSPDLKTAFAEEGTDDNCTVAWTDNGDGTWTAAVSFVDVLAQYFAFAKYTKPGKTVIRNTAPVSMSGGIVLDDGTRIKPEVSGGVVSWKVVAE